MALPVFSEDEHNSDSVRKHNRYFIVRFSLWFFCILIRMTSNQLPGSCLVMGCYVILNRCPNHWLKGNDIFKLTENELENHKIPENHFIGIVIMYSKAFIRSQHGSAPAAVCRYLMLTFSSYIFTILSIYCSVKLNLIMWRTLVVKLYCCPPGEDHLETKTQRQIWFDRVHAQLSYFDTLSALPKHP